MGEIQRKKPVATVGLSFTDTQMRYVEFSPDVTGSYLEVQRQGVVGISYDAVVEGVVQSIGEVTDSIKKLRSETKAPLVVFASSGDADLDSHWQELLLIGGFAHAYAVSPAGALDALVRQSDGSSVPLLYFPPTGNEAWAMYGGQVISRHSFPLSFNDILDIQDMVIDHHDEPIRLVGALPRSSAEMKATFDIYQISTRLPNLWRRCFDITKVIPPLEYDESFVYTLAIANGFLGTWFDVRPDEPGAQAVHPSASVLEKLVVQDSAEKEDAREQKEVAHENAVVGKVPEEAVSSTMQPEDEVQTNLERETPARPGSLKEHLSQAGPIPQMTPIGLHQEETQAEFAREMGERADETQETNGGVSSSSSNSSSRSVWLQKTDQLLKKISAKKPEGETASPKPGVGDSRENTQEEKL